jgi:hypothetical protein
VRGLLPPDVSHWGAGVPSLLIESWVVPESEHLTHNILTTYKTNIATASKGMLIE